MPVNRTMRDPVQYSWFLLQLTGDSALKCSQLALIKKKIKLTPQQFSILAAIKNIGGPVKPGDVAKWIDREPVSATMVLDRMERDGLLSRVRDLKDRRTLRLVVTPLGCKMYLQAIKPSHEVARNILSVLNPAELDSLNLIMDKIRQKSFKIRKVEHQVLDEKELKKNRPELKSPVKKKK